MSKPLWSPSSPLTKKRSCSPAAEKLFGYPKEEAIGIALRPAFIKKDLNSLVKKASEQTKQYRQDKAEPPPSENCN
ncbi:MAG: PAS domain-containing protein [Planctomycetota bacterium]|nr:PAS domain-containing protein [Planctomycetota bacterium]MDA1138482.1 PAS domain-containing protein [Planctomycetota bacterium]